MSRHRRLLVAAVAAVAGWPAVTAAPADATPAVAVEAPLVGAAGSLSNWAGYIAQGTAHEFTSASASWTMPAATCTAKKDLYAPWVGIDGSGDGTVEQTGVQTSCQSGSPVDSAWYEMYPASPVYLKEPVATGDVIDASVVFAGGTFTLTTHDVTAGWTKTEKKKLAGAKRLSAEAVIESPPAAYPTLAGVSFTDVTLNGATLASFSPVVTRSPGPGSTIETPGPITDGGDFTITAT